MAPAAEVMLGSVYATLGIFLLIAVRNPSSHRSLIAFTASKDEVTITGEDRKEYELTSGRIQLKKYVGQKVQVTGAERMEEGGVGPNQGIEP